MPIDRAQVAAAERRFVERTAHRQRNERLIREGRFFDADSPDRVEKWLARRATTLTGEAFFGAAPGAAETAAAAARARGVPRASLERMLGTNDLIGVAFLERGLQVARSVGRVWINVAGGKPMGYGTAFLISPRLLMTNHHVLEDGRIAARSVVEFDYQYGIDGVLCPSCTFPLEPQTFYFSDPHLDYAVVAVGESSRDGRRLGEFGFSPLIESEGKAIIAQWVNVVQHPNGEPKQLGLRENQLVDVLDDFLHYRTDTAPGSSGSPVFNDRWEVVGLHHSGVWDTNAAGQILAVDGRVWTADMGEHRIRWKANEGARISRIVAHLQQQEMTPAQRALLLQALDDSAPPTPSTSPARSGGAGPESAGTHPARVDPDGTVTWTVPLSVSVRLGCADAPVPPPAATPPGPTGGSPGVPLAAPPPGTPPGTDLDRVEEAARREFGARADVLNVRAGYVFRNGWITDERALVVTVRRKLAPAALREGSIPLLPDRFMDLPVEVTGPSVEDLMRTSLGPAASEAAFGPGDTLREEITYTRPPGVELETVSDTMEVTAHVSPDAGWPLLREFIGATQRRMVIGIYDFGAPHVVDAVAQLAEKPRFRKLTLVMQPGESVGEGTKADDLKDEEVVDAFRQAFGVRFENAWVSIGRVNGWVSSSYHIKVAVRDQQAFWLSSGNLQSSNQPNAEPLAEEPRDPRWLAQYNREWNAIVEHKELAKTLEACLLHDFANNVGADGREALLLPDLLMPEAFFIPSVQEANTPPTYFEPFRERRDFTVTPLLTPDNYHERVLELVRSARRELLIQNQTFKAPGQHHAKLRELIDAVMERHEAGVEVKVIFRVLFASDARKVLTDLKDYGFPTDIIRLQKNCHTKGIVVDRKRVLLGSQNWSNDGVSVNRDASLLFDDEPLAQYFAEIFDHDWRVRARQNIGSEKMPVEVASPDEPTPAGMVRLSWKDYMEMQ